jgi:hypothetical protein
MARVPGHDSRSPRLSPVVLAALGVSLLLFAGMLNLNRVRSADQSVADARARYEQTATAAQQILDYRERAANRGPSERPDEDVQAMVFQALDDAGLPTARQQQLSGSGRIRINAGSGDSSQEIYDDRVSVVLQPMSPTEVWNLLASWRSLGSNWRPVSLVMELSNRRGSDPVYSATIVFANRFEVPREE